jgi:UDP-N-acetylglucosamine acyltransferase
MTGAHAGHDCRIGDDCTFVSTSQLGGHVEVQDRVIVGGGTQVHQFVRLGRGSMLSGAMGLSADLPPWFMLTGNNLCGSINIVGLRRSGLGRDAIDDARWVYRTLYRSGLSSRSALDVLRERSTSPFVAEAIAFLESAKRPICPGRPKAIRSTVAAETRGDE